MRARFSVLIAAVAILCAAIGVSHAGAPGGPDVPVGFGFCKSGPNKDAPCTLHSECLPSQCVAEYLDGQATNLKGILTIVVDDDLSDVCPQSAAELKDANCPGLDADLDRRAIAMSLEVKAKGDTHVLADIYQANDASAVPWATITLPAGLDEENLGVAGELETRCDWIPRHRQPNPAMAQGLLDLAGLATGRPVIVKAKFLGPTPGAQHVGDDMASMLRCRVWIRFLDAPLLP